MTEQTCVWEYVRFWEPPEHAVVLHADVSPRPLTSKLNCTFRFNHLEIFAVIYSIKADGGGEGKSGTNAKAPLGVLLPQVKIGNKSHKKTHMSWNGEVQFVSVATLVEIVKPLLNNKQLVMIFSSRAPLHMTAGSERGRLLTSLMLSPNPPFDFCYSGKHSSCTGFSAHIGWHKNVFPGEPVWRNIRLFFP